MMKRRTLVGRERERDTLGLALLGDSRAIGGVVLEGPAGIGKTSVWAAAVDAARNRGAFVLTSRPSPDDAHLGYVGVADLLHGVDLGGLGAVPPREREALEAAVGRRQATVVDERLVYAALRSVLLALSARGRLVVAVDDLQWTDDGSLSALEFAARRVESSEVRFLFARRTSSAGREERVLEATGGLERLVLSPLSLDEAGRLVHERLGMTLSRRAVRRVFEVSGGNPLFVLELAKAVVAAGGAADGDAAVPLPDRVERLLGARVRGLDNLARRALVAASLGIDLSVAELIDVVGTQAVDLAVAADVVIVDGLRVRPSHPLLGEVACLASPLSERRDLHLRLARRAPDVERRALHLSAAAGHEDAETATIVAQAAAHGSARGAAGAAAELGERALRLTPVDDPVQLERRVEAAEYCTAAGMLARAVALSPALETLPKGPLRARVALMLYHAERTSSDDLRARLQLAVAESGPGSRLRNIALIRLAGNFAVGSIDDLGTAEELAVQALDLAVGRGDDQLQIEALAALMWARALLGSPIWPLAARRAALPDDLGLLYNGTDRILGVALTWSGRVDEARELFESLLALADERGEGDSYYALRVQLSEVELRSARFGRVAELLDEWERERPEAAGHGAGLLRCRALLAGGRGDAASADRLAREAMACAGAVGIPWHGFEAARALGLSQLLAGDPGAACRTFQELQARLDQARIGNPGAFPLAPDLIQALALTGEVALAQGTHDRLASQAQEQSNAWAAAGAARGAGFIALARGDDAAATTCFRDAAEGFDALGLPWDTARTLIGLGIAQRRLRRRSEARRTLEQAIEIFDQLGAPGWVEQARLELRRLGGRRPVGAMLTPSEARVAELVAEGMQNKQVAAVLVVSAGTVEAHLTSIYRKLGVRSRTELARALVESQGTGRPRLREQSSGVSPIPRSRRRA